MADSKRLCVSNISRTQLDASGVALEGESGDGSARVEDDTAALKRLEGEAALTVGSSSAEFARFIETEQQRWKPVIARAEIKPD